MGRYYTSYGDGYFYDLVDDEEQERQAWEQAKANYRSMTPEELGKAWDRQCRRHDSAIDRCEQINSPTIEDSQAIMNFIEDEFKRRGLSHHDYVLQED